jgi:hypothetical protein
MAEKHASSAEFAAVYIAEAHSQDEWPIGAQYSSHKQPKAIEERLMLAEDLLGNVDIPVYCDTMANTFEKEYSAWPLRFLILKGGEVTWVSNPSSESFAQPSIVAVEQQVMQNC